MTPALAWLQHLADYDIEPPFAQLDRPVARVKPEEADTKFGRHVAGHGTQRHDLPQSRGETRLVARLGL